MTYEKKIKAVGLFSGGLDSLLAIKTIEAQGIEVQAINFKTPFFERSAELEHIARENQINLHVQDISKPYLSVVENPRYGHGKNMNPCVDCKIFMLQQAQKYAQSINAHFIFTGEVLGQRPKSQKRDTLNAIENQSALKGKLLRPLSAKLLPPTQAEEKGWVHRDVLWGFSGRDRKPQLALAQKYNIHTFATPGGGCLLTESGYCEKLKDLLEHRLWNVENIRLLKAGRYFRIGKTIIIVGRNKEQNQMLKVQKQKDDFLCKVRDIPGPLTLIRGEKNPQIIEKAARITARYVTKNSENIKLWIQYGAHLEQEIEVCPQAAQKKLDIKRP
jgi:tRNA U34 2-thiouridine synthase MnmA/TrmU